MLKFLKITLRKALNFYRRRRDDNARIKKDKALVESHPEWVGLTKSERARLRDKDFWQYIAFKNVRGSLEDGYVSDVLYGKMLKILNAPNNNIFGNKNYFGLLLKYLPLPRAVIRNINGELMDENFNLLTKNEALEKMNAYENLVFKLASGSGHGQGVRLLKREDFAGSIDSCANHARGGGLHYSRNFEAA